MIALCDFRTVNVCVIYLEYTQAQEIVDANGGGIIVGNKFWVCRVLRDCWAEWEVSDGCDDGRRDGMKSVPFEGISEESVRWIATAEKVEDSIEG